MSLSLLLSGMILVMPREDDKYQRLSRIYFACFFVILGLAIFAFAMRPFIDRYLSIGLTNALGLTAYYYLYAGYAQHFRVKANVLKNVYYLVNLVLLVSIQLSLAKFYDVFAIRIFIFCLNTATICIVTLQLTRKFRDLNNPGDKISFYGLIIALLSNVSLIALWFHTQEIFLVYQKAMMILSQLVVVTIFGGILSSYLYDLVQRYYKESITDSMTEVHNRRYFYQRARNEIAAARRHQFPLCLVLTDIDNFKTVNDRFGHDVGDRVIIAFANMLNDSLRTEDLMARFGGEEFVMLLPQTTLEQARQVVERMRQKTKTISVPGLEKDFEMSASFGGVQISEFLELDYAIKTADSLLYKAKQSGRDRAEFELLKVSDYVQ